MQNDSSAPLVIRRVLFSVSDKEGLSELGRIFQEQGAELVATGRTASALLDAGLSVVPIEKISGSPTSFQGRMKTLSFPVCSGILYRRGDSQDELDLRELGIKPIDCVVVNFYPFGSAFHHLDISSGISQEQLIEEIDIGGPTLVRAAAKNSPDVLVLTNPSQYSNIIQELKTEGQILPSTVQRCASEAWDCILNYDSVIARELGSKEKKILKYGENPHQKSYFHCNPDSPIEWSDPVCSTNISYNNVLDLSSAYMLASDLNQVFPSFSGVVIMKHNNPCGVSWVPLSVPGAQKIALMHAWEGDPVSAFGGCVVFTQPLEEETVLWLRECFIEFIAAPELRMDSSMIELLLAKRKNLKGLRIHRWGDFPKEIRVDVPGGCLYQSPDQVQEGTVQETLRSVTELEWPKEKEQVAQFGILVCKSLKSNAIALVREVNEGSRVFQLVGAGQGQPNRIDALCLLALPRARIVLQSSGGRLSECVLVSDAFCPFRDTVDIAHRAGIQYIVQPGGSLRDAESIQACNENEMSMVFTGMRHFRHFI